MDLENVKRIPIRGKKGEGSFALVSEEDFEYLVKFKWHLSVVKYPTNSEGDYMHRIIAERMGLDLKKEIDHKDRNPLNNHRSNLRAATRAENCRNKDPQSNNTSGHPGVTFDKRRNKWYATVWISRKRKYLGYFNTFEEAKAARIAGEIEHYGEFRPIH